MRTYPQDEYDWETVRRLKAPEWMVDMLKCNPSYTHWGPHEDYMSNSEGWNSPIINDSWSDHEIELDDYNEVFHFYFQIERDATQCEDCGGTGHSLAIKQLHNDWYDHAETGRRWCDKLEQPEVDALWDAKRLSSFKTKPTPEQVNAWSRTDIFGHDAINQSICVRARAKAQGIWTNCDVCEESGFIFTEPEPRLSLVYWLGHPRKGASRGVEISRIEREDLPAVKAFLMKARQRSYDRFSGIDLIPE